MADYLPVNRNGADPFTLPASAAITGGQVLYVSGNGTVAPTAGANGAAIGIAQHDAPNGGLVTIWPLSGVHHETTSPAGVNAGAALTSSTAGGIDSGTLATVAAAGTHIGTAVTTAAAGQKAQWLGR